MGAANSAPSGGAASPPPRPRAAFSTTSESRAAFSSPTRRETFGGNPPTPVIFGGYELARTSDPSAKLAPTAAFQDRMPQATKLEKTIVPVGAYDPVRVHTFAIAALLTR